MTENMIIGVVLHLALHILRPQPAFPDPKSMLNILFATIHGYDIAVAHHRVIIRKTKE